MPYSSDNAFGAVEGDDIYQPDHGRYVLMSSPGVGQMQFLGFSKVYYDKKDHTMRDKDSSRPDDFISISGSKMRKLAALAAKPCPPTIPSDLIAAKCMCAAAATRAAVAPRGDGSRTADRRARCGEAVGRLAQGEGLGCAPAVPRRAA